jgi:tripartite-type tricarboxylate transporter receptor subunit TctC
MIVGCMRAVLIGLAMFGSGAASAQGTPGDWPTKPVRIVTGFAAGGIGDLGARLLAEHITRTTGQQAVVENRTGAAGTLGMDVVAKAAPDGTTIGLALNGNLVINPFIQKSMPFDAQKDLVPVAAIGDAPQMIALSTEVPARTFKEFQALAKEKPGAFTYGSAGPGSLPHLSLAEFAHMAGIQLVHVPYRGNAPAMTDLIAGRIHLVSSSIGQFRPALEVGKIRLLLTATKNRLAYLPDLPTSAEAGLPGYLMSVWIGVVAPAGTPQPVVERIHATVQGMLKEPAARNAMAGAGLDLMTMSQPEFASFVKTEYARWEKIVKDAGVEKE